MEEARNLLADDHAIVGAGTRSAFGDSSDWEVIGVAGDGRDLAAQLASRPVDLSIVDDVAMPRTRERASKLHEQMTGLKRNVSALGSHNRQLIEQLAEQVNLLDRVNRELQNAHRRLLTEREAERKLLARELHDDTIQNLLSLNYDLEDVAARPEVTPELGEAIMAIRAGVKSAIGDLRLICSDLRPPTIDSLGLGAALRSFVADWNRRWSRARA